MSTVLPTIRPCLACLESSFSKLRLSPTLNPRFSPLFRPVQQQVRNATHKSEGRANGPRDGAGKRLGCKKTQGQYVIPGNIIFKQRGTKWMPGDNVGLGRDHTIYATKPGYVRFYRDPARNPDKKYIGVALRPDDRLPAPWNCPTRRLLGMTAHKMVEQVRRAEDGADGGRGPTPGTGANTTTAGLKTGLPPLQSLQNLRPGYQYRVANWEIGKSAERAGITVKPFDRNDRFAAWRKRNARRAQARETRSVRQKKKSN